MNSKQTVYSSQHNVDRCYTFVYWIHKRIASLLVRVVLTAVNVWFTICVMHKDSQLIAELGGPAKVAEMLGFNKRAGGVQRVQNWLTRGIPADVKLAHPSFFLKDLIKAGRKTKAEV